MSKPILTTHMLIDSQDLALLRRQLGRRHSIAERAAQALADLSDRQSNRYRAAARRHACEGALEVDGNAVVSIGADPGAYVQSWLWIDADEIA